MHEQRRLLNWQDLKSEVNNLKSEFYVLPPASTAPSPPVGATKFLQIAVSLTPYSFFTKNLAGVTKRWNVPASPNETNPARRSERTGAKAGNSISYTAGQEQAKPSSTHEFSRACLLLCQFHGRRDRSGCSRN